MCDPSSNSGRRTPLTIDVIEALGHVRDPGVGGGKPVDAVGAQEARVVRVVPGTLGLGKGDAGSRPDLSRPDEARRRV